MVPFQGRHSWNFWVVIHPSFIGFPWNIILASPYNKTLISPPKTLRKTPICQTIPQVQSFFWCEPIPAIKRWRIKRYSKGPLLKVTGVITPQARSKKGISSIHCHKWHNLLVNYSHWICGNCGMITKLRVYPHLPLPEVVRPRVLGHFHPFGLGLLNPPVRLTTLQGGPRIHENLLMPCGGVVGTINKALEDKKCVFFWVSTNKADPHKVFFGRAHNSTYNW